MFRTNSHEKTFEYWSTGGVMSAGFSVPYASCSASSHYHAASFFKSRIRDAASVPKMGTNFAVAPCEVYQALHRHLVPRHRELLDCRH